MTRTQEARANARTPNAFQSGASKPALSIVRLSQLSPQARFRRKRLSVFLATFVGIVGIVGVVVFQVAMTQGQYRLDQLERVAEKQEARYEQLRLEVAALESPGRISAVAKDRFGMTEPSKVTYLVPIENEELNNEESRPSSKYASTGSSWSEVKRQLAINP